jgi:acyl-[acyl-carrier-protein] desaturase
MMGAIERQVTSFTMPGIGIPGFAEHAKRIAQAGIYDLAVHHEQILVPVVIRGWDVEHVAGLSAEGEQARERLMTRMGKSERVARRVAQRRDESALVSV